MSTAAGAAVPAHPTLSICIATLNRAKFIGETLESIVRQLEPGVDLVVVDGASSDNTAEVIAQYAERCPVIHYYREPVNSGVDRDYDKAVGYATGEFCWLMTDDDLLCPDAVRQVLRAIGRAPDLIVVNAEVRSADLSRHLGTRLPSAKDTEYDAGRTEQAFVDLATHLTFIGCVVVRRRLWLERDRATYYGSLFIHVGVIFQHPLIERTLVIGTPLVCIRYGNAMWVPKWFEIWMFKWPDLIWSFSDLSERAKASVSPREPWRKLTRLLFYRAMGAYSINEWRRFLSGRLHGPARALALVICFVPGVVANAAASIYILLRRRTARIEVCDLSSSRYANGVTRIAARLLGV